MPVEQVLPLSERHIGYNAGIASHLDKMTYRVFLPMLNQVFPFGIWTLVIACHIGVLAILWFSYQSVAKQILDPVCAALSCWAIAASYAGQYGFQDCYLGDSVAVGFLMAAMVTRNSIATSLLIMLGGFTDERAIASAPIILLYHVLRQKDFEENSRIFPLMLVRFIKVGAPVIFGVIAYAAIRLGFTFATGERSGSSMLASIDILRSHFYNDYPQLFFKVFEFLWIFPVLFLLEYGSKKPPKKFIAIMFGFSLVLAAVPAMVVWDFDRSLFYLLPGILLSICFLPVSLDKLRLILLAVLVSNLLWLYPSSSGFRKIDHFISRFIILEKK